MRSLRKRCRQLLGKTQTGRPPTQRIEQENFNAVTRRTSQSDSTVAKRKTIFKTPAQKIAAANLVAGTVFGHRLVPRHPVNLHEKPSSKVCCILRSAVSL